MRSIFTFNWFLDGKINPHLSKVHLYSDFQILFPSPDKNRSEQISQENGLENDMFRFIFEDLKGQGKYKKVYIQNISRLSW